MGVSSTPLKIPSFGPFSPFSKFYHSCPCSVSFVSSCRPFSFLYRSAYKTTLDAFPENRHDEDIEACDAIASLIEVRSIDSAISNFILPLQGKNVVSEMTKRVHCSLNINTETGRLSCRRPNLQNQPALEKDRYMICRAFIADPGLTPEKKDSLTLEEKSFPPPGNSLVVADYGQAVEKKQVLLEWYGKDKPPVPLLKDAFACERRKAKMLNFSIAHGKTPMGLAKDWKVSVKEARKIVKLWYNERKEVREWQEARKREANTDGCVQTLLGRGRHAARSHIERAATNTPVHLLSVFLCLFLPSLRYPHPGGLRRVVPLMCAMLEISRNARLKHLNWRLLLQVHDKVILEGPSDSAEEAKAIVVECMSKPFNGRNILKVDLVVDAKCVQTWYDAKGDITPHHPK